MEISVESAFQALERAHRTFTHCEVDYAPGVDSSPGAVVSSVIGVSERLLGMRSAVSRGRKPDLSKVFQSQSYESLAELINNSGIDPALPESLRYLLEKSYAVYDLLRRWDSPRSGM